MVSKSEKQQMANYVAEKLESSGLYKVHIIPDRSLISINNGDENALVILHDRKRSKDELLDLRKKAKSKGMSESHVFYQDEKMFHVETGDTSSARRGDKSLKNIDDSQFDAMLTMRDLEKTILGISQNHLLYYQPENEDFPESLRCYHMTPVVLDYSHLSFDDPARRFGVRKESIDYKIPVEKYGITDFPQDLRNAVNKADSRLVSPKYKIESAGLLKTIYPASKLIIPIRDPKTVKYLQPELKLN